MASRAVSKSLIPCWISDGKSMSAREILRPPFASSFWIVAAGLKWNNATGAVQFDLGERVSKGCFF